MVPHRGPYSRRGGNIIKSIDQEDGVIEGDEKPMDDITKFYKELFGKPDEISLIKTS